MNQNRNKNKNTTKGHSKHFITSYNTGMGIVCLANFVYLMLNLIDSNYIYDQE